MASMNYEGGVLVVKLSADETASWREHGRAAAKFRVAIKRPARQRMAELECGYCIVYAHDGGALESVVRNGAAS